MSVPPLLLAALLCLVLSVLLGVAVLLRDGAQRRLRARVRLAGSLVPAEGDAAQPADLPSIRLARPIDQRWLLGVLRLLGYHADVPAAYRVPSALVVLGAVALAALFALRLEPLVGRGVAAGIGLAMPLLLARLVFAAQFAAYRETLYRQLPDALDQMVRTVRAGLPLAEALRSVSREQAFPTDVEFARVVGDVAIGRPLDQSLIRLAERTRITEYTFLAVTLGLQSQTGGSLSETLETLADTVRKRVALRKRAAVLAAEARAQAVILAVLPFIAALAMAAIQPFYLHTFTETEAGRSLAITGILLLVIGLAVIRRMIRQAGSD
jgi:tight adherence protein B